MTATVDEASLRLEFGSVFEEDRALSRIHEELSQRYQYLSGRQALGQYLTESEETELKELEELKGPEVINRQKSLIARLEKLTQLVGPEIIKQWEIEAKQLLENATAARHQQQPSAAAVGPAGNRLVLNEAATILCCICGVAIESNETRMCLDCVRARSDVTDSIPRQGVIHLCKPCGRYEGERQWLKCEWESKELLALCLKKIKAFGDGSKAPRLVDAKFVWTESHSRRIKIQLTLQKEVIRNTTLQQQMIIEFKVAYKQCEDCTKSQTPHLWIAQVQVRQRAEHKRSLLYLEQLILAHHAHENCVNIVDNPDGLDFQFGKVQHANNFVNFVRNFLPVKVQAKATQQVSHDCKNNTYHNKYTTLLEIAGVCRDDLVFLKKSTASKLGGCSQIMLCERVSTGIRLRDPFTLRGCDIDNENYWKEPFEAFMRRRDLSQFVVMNVEPVDFGTVNKAGVAGRFLTGMMSSTEEKSTVKKSWGALSKNVLVEVELCKQSDMGKVDSSIMTRSHLGHILRVGDFVECFDLTKSNSKEGEKEYDSFIEKVPYQVIIVRKVPEKKVAKLVNFDLKELPKASATGQDVKVSATMALAHQEFLQDLQDDDEMQKNLATLIQNMKI